MAGQSKLWPAAADLLLAADNKRPVYEKLSSCTQTGGGDDDDDNIGA